MDVSAIGQMVLVLQHPCPASPVHAGQQGGVAGGGVAHRAGGVLLQGLQPQVVPLQLAAGWPHNLDSELVSNAHSQHKLALRLSLELALLVCCHGARGSCTIIDD